MNHLPPFPVPDLSRNPRTPQSATEWERLRNGKSIGKKSVQPFFTIGQSLRTSTVNLLEISADDDNALPVILTLAPPQIINLPFNATLKIEDLTGEQDNAAMVAVLNRPFGLARAVIQWGAGGVGVEAEVDFINGATVNLAGSFVRVFTRIEIEGGATQAYYALSAFLTPGTARGSSRARYTGQSVGPGLAGAQSTVQIIPKFAESVTVLGGIDANPPTAWTGWIVFYRSANIGGPGFPKISIVDVSSARSPDPIPVPNSAMYYTFIAGVDNAVFTPVFNLAL